MDHTDKYWFRAKKYGWGWGIPLVWQGWATLAVYGGFMILVAFAFPPEENPMAFLFLTMVLSALLVWVCWIKGEPIKWRRRKSKT